MYQYKQWHPNDWSGFVVREYEHRAGYWLRYASCKDSPVYFPDEVRYETLEEARAGYYITVALLQPDDWFPAGVDERAGLTIEKE